MLPPTPSHPQTALSVPPISQQINPAIAYIATLRSGVSKTGMQSTLKRVCECILQTDFANWTDAVTAIDWQLWLTPIALQAVIASYGSSNPNTLNKVRALYRGIANVSFDLGIITADQLTRVNRVKTIRGEVLPAGRYINASEREKMIEKADSDTSPIGTRDAALLAIMTACGLRRSEVAALSLSDWQPSTGEMLVKGKGNKQRLVYPASWAVALLSDWLSVRGEESGGIFCPIKQGGKLLPDRHLTPAAINLIVANRAKAADVENVRTHDFRRSLASDLLDRCDVKTVADVLGHANIATTGRYDRRGERAKKAAMQAVQGFTRERL